MGGMWRGKERQGKKRKGDRENGKERKRERERVGDKERERDLNRGGGGGRGEGSGWERREMERQVGMERDAERPFSCSRSFELYLPPAAPASVCALILCAMADNSC